MSANSSSCLRPHVLTYASTDAIMGNDSPHRRRSERRNGRLRRSSRYCHRRSARSSKQCPLDLHRQHHQSLNPLPISSHLQQSYNTCHLLYIPPPASSSSSMGRLCRHLPLLTYRETLASGTAGPLQEWQNLLVIRRRHRHRTRLPHTPTATPSNHQPSPPTQAESRTYISLHTWLHRLSRERRPSTHSPYHSQRKALRRIRRLGYHMVSSRSERGDHLRESAESETTGDAFVS